MAVALQRWAGCQRAGARTGRGRETALFTRLGFHALLLISLDQCFVFGCELLQVASGVGVKSLEMVAGIQPAQRN